MTDSSDRVYVEGTVHPNKTALQFYVPSEAASESAFPFAHGDDYRAMTVPGTDALLVWPTGQSPTFPLTVEDCPDEQVPWPLDTEREPERERPPRSD